MMRTSIGRGFMGVVLAVGCWCGSARAQYTANNQTNIIQDGSVSNWAGSYNVGNGYYGDILLVTNASTLASTGGGLGIAAANSNNAVTVTGAGSIWSNSTNLVVGFAGSGNSLTLANSGKVFNAYGYIGSNSSGNAVLVTGGAIWSNRNEIHVGEYGSSNSLTISNGGVVNSGVGWNSLGFQSASSSNTVLVTGNGSVWNDAGPLYVGENGSKNSMTVTNGGRVNCGVLGMSYNSPSSYSNTLFITGTGSVVNASSDLNLGNAGNRGIILIADGGLLVDNSGWLGGNITTSSNNVITVTDPGSVWSNRSLLVIGYNGHDNNVTISNSGVVFAGSNVTVGVNASSSNNSIVINSSGKLISTNSGAGVVDVRRGTLSLNSGTMLANKLLATNGALSVLQFNAGLLGVGQATVINGQAFEVGDGVQTAQLDLRGGTNNFAGGLNIASNAQLTGSGVISNGNVLVRQGGVLAPGSGSGLGTLAISNNLTLQGGLDIKLNNLSGANGTASVVNVTGLLDLTGGMVTFEPQDTLTNSVYVFGYYGTLLGTLSATNGLPGGYLFENNYNGNQLALVAIPEPVAIGSLLLLGGALVTWRRLRRWRI